MTTVSERPTKFPSLTSVRFIAAMSVLLYHLSNVDLLLAGRKGSTGATSLLGQFIRTYLPSITVGYLAVDFFFILSGFVLAHVYFQQLDEGRFSTSEFLKKRLARIYPLHFVVTAALGLLVVGALLGGLPINDHDRFSLKGLAVNLLLLNGLHLTDGLTWNGPSWCVSCEWHGYLAFPVAAMIFLKLRRHALLALAGALAWFLALYYGTSTEWLLTQRTYNFGTLRLAAEFPIGLALYGIYQNYRGSGSRVVRPVHVLGTGVLTFAALQLRLDQSVIVVLFAIMVFVLAAADTYYDVKGLNHRWLLYGGEISYALYLVHGPFLATWRRLYHPLQATRGSVAEAAMDVAGVLLAIALAATAFRWVETPAYRWTLRTLGVDAIRKPATPSSA